MQTSLRRRHRDRVVRRGIGMTIESDCYATEVRRLARPVSLTQNWVSVSDLEFWTVCSQAGRSHFQDQLTSIRYW